MIGEIEERARAAAGQDRVVVFTDSSSAHAQFLTKAFLAAARDDAGVSIAGVIDTGTVDRLAFLRSYAWWVVVRRFNRDDRKPAPISSKGLRAICREFAVPYRATGRTDLHDQNVEATILVSIYCLRKFSREFLERFEFTVNYHNGRLPAYRGRLATNWELYRGETSFGFTFHRMSEAIDEGNILVAGSVSGDGTEYKFELEHRKTLAAAKHWPEVIEKMKRREEGRPQAGPAESFTRHERLAVRNVGDPRSIRRGDLERRIRCFEFVRLDLQGRALPVSAIEESSGGARFEFVTGDGARLRAVRFDRLPYRLYMVRRALNRLRETASASARRFMALVGTLWSRA